MAGTKAARVEEIDELCDDLMEHLVDGEQAEAVACAEAILEKVRAFFDQLGPR